MPETTDETDETGSIDLTVNFPTADGLGTVGSYVPEVTVRPRDLGPDGVRVECPDVSLGGEYDGMRLIIDPANADALAAELTAAAAEARSDD